MSGHTLRVKDADQFPMRRFLLSYLIGTTTLPITLTCTDCPYTTTVTGYRGVLAAAVKHQEKLT